MDVKKLLFYIALLLLSSKAYVQENECEWFPIPSEHLGNLSIEYVTDKWSNSGADIFPLDIPPERQYDVSDYDIFPGMQPCGQKILDMISSIPHSSQNPVMFYFPPGAYLVDKPLVLNGGVILKGAGGDGEIPKQSHFHFDLSNDYAHPLISISGEKNGVEDIYIIDDTKCNKTLNYNYQKNIGDSTKQKYPDDFYQHTFVISGSNNFIRGVESCKTRRFHVEIKGNNNTISGCYFHVSIDYSDKGGRGYGVDVKVNGKYNRIEDNIFSYLRHAMVLEGDPLYNVFAYNFSNDIHATGGNFFEPASDLLLHGRPSNVYSVGPELNLLEGNYVERARVDYVDKNKKLPNGPYNTFFRNHALEKFEISKAIHYEAEQYKQNVIGCNMEPTNKTIERLDEYGYRKNYPDFSGLSSSYCSLYLGSEPDFFLGWIQWPYTPWDNKIIPAKYRWDSHDPQWGYNEVPYAINQGWSDYLYLCAPPNYKFKNKTFVEMDDEFRAMHNIILDNIKIYQDNELLFHAEESVKILQGTKIQSDNNNHVIIKAGNVCSGKSNYSSKYDIYTVSKPSYNKNDSYSDIESEKSTEIVSEQNENDRSLKIFPNPNNGSFQIITDYKIIKDNITIFDIFGNTIDFNMNNDRGKYDITISNNYTGIVFVRYSGNNLNKVVKVIIK